MAQGSLGAALFSDKPLARNSVLLVVLALAALLLGFGLDHRPRLLWGLILVAPLALVGLYDLFQTHHSLRRNYPLTARARWFFEWLRPFLRAYIVESDLDGRPFCSSIAVKCPVSSARDRGCTRDSTMPSAAPRSLA